MDDTLLKFVKKQIDKHIDIITIKQSLLQSGWELEDISAAINQVQRSETKSVFENDHDDSSIIKYIKTQLKQGYDATAVREYLLQHGYNVNQVDNAFDIIYHPVQKQGQEHKEQKIVHEHHLATSTVLKIVAVFFGIAIILGGGYFGFDLLTSKNDKLLDLIVKPIDIEVYPGEELHYSVDLFNLGNSKDPFDVVLTFRILDSNNDIISEQESSLALSTTTRFEESIRISSRVLPGQYKLKAFARYNDEIATSSFTFSILSEGEEKQETPVDILLDDEQEEQPMLPSRPEREKSIDRRELRKDIAFATILDRAREVSRQSKESGMAICNQIDDPLRRDVCYREIVDEIQDSDICLSIIDDELRDDCLLQFVIRNNFNDCDKLVLKENKDYCNTLADIYLMNEYIENNNQQAMYDMAPALGFEDNIFNQEPGEEDFTIEDYEPDDLFTPTPEEE